MPNINAPETSPFLDSREAANYLRTTSGVLATWRYEGIGPKFYRVGRKVLYRVEDLDAFVGLVAA